VLAKRRDGLAPQRATEVAPCRGWIDGLPRQLDEARWLSGFRLRQPRSPCSRVNKAGLAALGLRADFAESRGR